MAWQVGIKPGNLINIDFRHKLGDNAGSYAVKFNGIIDGEEKEIIKMTSELIGQNWGMGFFKPIASDYTDDVMNETADIVLGDAWLPEYTKDPKGNNIVIVRNKEISNIIKDSILEDRLALTTVGRETIFRSQKGHFEHTRDGLNYRLYKLNEKNQWTPKKRVQASKDKISKPKRKIQDERITISLASHEVYLKALNLHDFNFYYNKMSKLSKKYIKRYRKIKIREMTLKEIIKKVFRKVFRTSK